MSLLAALVLAAASARVESVSLTTLDSRLAVRVLVSGTPGLVAVHREGDVARVSIMDADLGLRFAGGRRFSWTPSDGFDPALLAATPAKLDRLEIAAGASEVSVLLHVPPEVSVDVRRDSRGLLLVFRGASVPAEPERVAQRSAGAGRRVPPSRRPRLRWPSRPSCPRRGRAAEPVAGRRPRRWRRARGRAGRRAGARCRRGRAPAAPPPASPSRPTRRISRSASSPPRLARPRPRRRGRWPSSTRGSSRPARPRRSPRRRCRRRGRRAGAGRGPRRWAPSACAPRWTRATWTPTPTWRSTAVPTQDQLPRGPAARGGGGAGRRRPLHARLRAGPPRPSRLRPGQQLAARRSRARPRPARRRARDAARPGPLPGRHPRHARGGPRGRVLLRPRPLPPQRRRRRRQHRGRPAPERRARGRPRARSASRSRRASSTTTPGPPRRASASSSRRTSRRSPPTCTTPCRAPTSGPRPSRRAHSARLSLSGEILPLLTGELSVGYRSQDTPNAGAGRDELLRLRHVGRAHAPARPRVVARHLREPDDPGVGVRGERLLRLDQRPGHAAGAAARPSSSSGAGSGTSGTTTGPSRSRSAARARTASSAGTWACGARSGSNLFLSGAYRSEDRRSNVDTFDTDADGFYLQLEWDIFGAPAR